LKDFEISSTSADKEQKAKKAIKINSLINIMYCNNNKKKRHTGLQNNASFNMNVG
jgi:hypothetical protein